MMKSLMVFDKRFIAKALGYLFLFAGVGMFIIFVVHTIVVNLFSNETESLGQWGDYVGGFLGAIFALCNLGVILLLTIYIEDSAEKHSRNNMATARKISIIEFKIGEYKDFKKKVDNIFL